MGFARLPCRSANPHSNKKAKRLGGLESWSCAGFNHQVVIITNRDLSVIILFSLKLQLALAFPFSAQTFFTLA